MTPERKWPNNALRERNEAAHLARHALRQLLPLLEGDAMTQTETVRRLGLAVMDLQTIDKLMIGAGAPKEC